MAKLKVGRNASSAKKPKKKSVVLDEITLGSSEDESSIDNNDEVMDVDEDNKENGDDFKPEKAEIEADNEPEKAEIKAENEPEKAEIEPRNGLEDADIKHENAEIKHEQDDDNEAEKGENEAQIELKEEKMDISESVIQSEPETTTKIEVKPEVSPVVVNGDPAILNGDDPNPGDNAQPVQPLVEPPKPLVSPRPGFILSASEVKNLHLVPRVALVPLKYDKKYHLELKEKRTEEEQQEDLEATKLLDMVQHDYSNVIQLGDMSAIIQPNGDYTTCLN